jgi:hypothetical protein
MSESDMPIIQPGHIELSDVAETPVSEMPSPNPVPSMAMPSPAAPAPQPVQTMRAPDAPQTAPVNPGQVSPLADFAAAAQMLGQKPAADESDAGANRQA